MTAPDHPSSRPDPHAGSAVQQLRDVLDGLAPWPGEDAAHEISRGLLDDARFGPWRVDALQGPAADERAATVAGDHLEELAFLLAMAGRLFADADPEAVGLTITDRHGSRTVLAGEVHRRLEDAQADLRRAADVLRAWRQSLFMRPDRMHGTPPTD